jgi:signal transduction histidine kinase
MIKLFRSTSVRIALGYAGLVILSALTLSAFIWWRTAVYLDHANDAVIIAETQSVGDRLRDFGLAGAIATIKDRVKASPDKHAIYLLTDPVLQPLAGNLDAWPIQVGSKSGWYEVPLVRDGVLHTTRMLHVVLPSGFHLLVGRDIQDKVALRGLILGALGWTALAALVLAVAGGILVRRVVLKRVATITDTTNAIVHGDLARRMPAPNSSDEFDQLVRTINGMLDQIQLLVEGARRASDAVAHDLRTPLAELRSRLESIAREGGTEGPTQEEIHNAIDDVDRLIDIFNSLLRLADIQSGARRSGFRRADLVELVTDVAELFGPSAAEAKLSLETDVPNELAIEGDPQLLAQALSNLVDNAIKYTPAGGRVMLRVAKLGETDVEVEVSDTGPGISEAEKPFVRRQFQRGGNAGDKPGIGLGLSLVDAVAALHGGELVLEDNAPGLKAVLRLPVGRVTPKPPKAGQSSLSSALPQTAAS